MNNITLDSIKKLRVQDLKNELKTRNLITTGKKQELVDRLSNAVKSGIEPLGEDLNYTTLTLAQLRAELGIRGLKKGGRTHELVEKLQQNDKEIEKTQSSVINIDEDIGPYEQLTKDRDYEYYLFIKPHVLSMPDLYTLSLKSYGAITITHLGS